MLEITADACVWPEQVKYKTAKGKSGFAVYKFELKRRPNQGKLYSKALVFKGGATQELHR